MATRATSEDGAGRPPSLEQLLTCSGRGGADAFTEFYDRISPHVYGLVTSLIRDQVVAEQITYDAFIEMWRRAATYDADRSSALAWTLVITRRLALTQRRLSRPANNLQVSYVVGHSLSVPAVGLSPAQAAAVELAWLGGFDHREIDAQLDTGTPAAALLSEGLQLRRQSPKRTSNAH